MRAAGGGATLSNVRQDSRFCRNAEMYDATECPSAAFSWIQFKEFDVCCMPVLEYKVKQSTQCYSSDRDPVLVMCNARATRRAPR